MGLGDMSVTFKDRMYVMAGDTPDYEPTPERASPLLPRAGIRARRRSPTTI